MEILYGLRLQGLIWYALEMSARYQALTFSASLTRMVNTVRESLGVESCAIFLLSGGGERAVSLAASSTVTDEPDTLPNAIPIASIPGGSLTGHLANELCREGSPRVIRLSEEQLSSAPYGAGKVPKHLKSGKCRALLAVALKDRRGKFCGMLKAENKKPDASSYIEFSNDDELIAESVADRIQLILENQTFLDHVRGLMQSTQGTQNKGTVLRTLLARALDMVGGDRGDFALRRKFDDKLVIEATTGEAALRPLELGMPVPDSGFISYLWRSREQIQRTGDVSTGPYYCAHPSTKSEIAVRIELDGESVGVLNIEAFHLAAFDEHDADALILLSRFAAIAIGLCNSQYPNWGLVKRLLDRQNDEGDDFVEILKNLRDSFGLDASLIYIADVAQKRLTCRASIGCEQLEIDPRTFGHAFDATSFASHVFQSKRPAYSPNPAADPRVNQKARLIFDIRGPLIGLPLISGNILGVMVCWSRKGAPPTFDDIERLEPLAGVVAWTAKRNQHEAELLEETKRYRELLHKQPHNAFCKNTNGVFTFANDGFCKLVGRTREEIVGYRDHDLFPKPLADKYTADDRSVMEKRQSLEYTEENWSQIHGTRVVRVFKAPLINDSSNLIGVQGVFWDITAQVLEQVTLTRRAQESESRLLSASAIHQEFVDKTNDIVYVHDLRGNFVEMNPAGTRLLGYSREELCMMNIEQILAPESLHAVRDLIRHPISRRAEMPLIHEMVILTRGRAKRILEITSMLVRRSLGRREIQGVGRDITERKRTELQLLESNQRLQQVFIRMQRLSRVLTVAALPASSVHNFADPLTFIQAEIANLQIQLKTSQLAEAQLSAQRIRRTADQGIDELNGMLRFLKTGKPEFKAENFLYLVERRVNDPSFQQALDKKGIKCVWVPNNSCNIEVQIDVKLFALALKNIFMNAVVHLPANSMVKVVLNKEVEGILVLNIADNGEGFPVGVVDSVENAEGVHENVDKTKIGIGLFLAKTAVELNNGLFSLGRSPELGGAMVTIKLRV